LSFLFAVLVLSAAFVRAEETPSTNSAAVVTNRMPAVLVTSTRIASSTAETPTTVTVIDGGEMTQQQAVRVEEVLRQVPGLEVVQTGQPGSQSTVFIRGSERDQTLVLVDGIPVNSGFDNSFDFAHLSAANIERIEVLRGPQSALYGSEAIGGVINIITKRGEGKPTGSAMVEAGSHDSFHTREQFSGSFGPLSLAVGGGYYRTDNERPNSFYRRSDVSARASWQALERLNISFLSSYLNSKNGVPDSRFVNDPNDYQRDEQSLFALTLNGQPIEKWDSTLKLSYTKNRLEANGPYRVFHPIESRSFRIMLITRF
jgi:vitamin B12 transporter